MDRFTNFARRFSIPFTVLMVLSFVTIGATAKVAPDACDGYAPPCFIGCHVGPKVAGPITVTNYTLDNGDTYCNGVKDKYRCDPDEIGTICADTWLYAGTPIP